jgi:hypothetical protein
MVSRRTLSTIVFALGIGFSAACLYNVLGDHTEVLKEANALACGDLGPDCDAKMTRMMKTPISHTYQISTPKRSVEVVCRRAAIFVGPYGCSL